VSSAPKLPTKLRKQVEALAVDIQSTEPLPPEAAVAETHAPGLIKTSKDLPNLASSTPTQSPNMTNESAAEAAVPGLDDTVSDAAVDEISAHDSDELLMAEDAAAKTLTVKTGSNHRLAAICKRKLTWVLVILALLIVVFAVPISRYRVLGLILKKPYTIDVRDSVTNTPVSEAVVHLDNNTLKTNASGQATFHVPVGYGELSITKQYYQSYDERIAVGVRRQSTPASTTLVATGRQVPITVTNQITGQPVSDATITVLDTSARTNTSGKAEIVLPTKARTYPALISGSGYNSTQSMVTVVDSVSVTNSFKIVPAGKVYFLSNSSGTIDVVGTNLDGSDRQVVLAGTGNESSATTQLLQSLDWKYLMLSATRSAGATTSGLYLINTANNNALTTVESSNVTVTPIGWSGHYFIYEAQNMTLGPNQPSQYVLKSFDADTGHNSILDQTDAIGSSTDYTNESLGNFFLLGSKLIYTKTWQGDSSYYSSNNVAGSIDTIDVDGQNQAPLQQFSMTGNGTNLSTLESVMYGANQIYFAADYSDGSTQYYNYNDGSVSSISLSSTAFSSTAYTPSITSPSGSSAAYSTTRDGQYVLLTGAPGVATSTQHTIATLPSSYTFYGWYTDTYILLTYKGSQLYILPASGLANGVQPLKVTDYLGQ
jgi:hypothetical protein